MLLFPCICIKHFFLIRKWERIIANEILRKIIGGWFSRGWLKISKCSISLTQLGNRSKSKVIPLFTKKKFQYRYCPVNFAKFWRTLLWNTVVRLLLYIARTISTWREVCLYPIYCSFIWFNNVIIIKTIEKLLICLKIQNEIRHDF